MRSSWGCPVPVCTLGAESAVRTAEVPWAHSVEPRVPISAVLNGKHVTLDKAISLNSLTYLHREHVKSCPAHPSSIGE